MNNNRNAPRPRQIVAGNTHSCALTDNGVQCWGNDYAIDYGATPTDLGNPIQISVGDVHVCALKETGVKCWGKNFAGQLNVSAEIKAP